MQEMPSNFTYIYLSQLTMYNVFSVKFRIESKFHATLERYMRRIKWENGSNSVYSPETNYAVV